MSHSTPILLSTLFLVVSLMLLGQPQLMGRIGEAQSMIESRVTQSGGIQYRDETIKNNRMQGASYTKLLYLLENYDLRIYFKTADGRKPRQSGMDARKMSSGWDLHVVYINGRSVIETYRRSSAMTESEFNQLLKLQAGDSYWLKIKEASKDDEVFSIIGSTMERADGAVRAVRQRNYLVLIDRDLDELLAKKMIDGQNKAAPVSVRGF